MTLEHNHRVFGLTEADRKNLTFKRESSLVTNATLIADAIDLELPRIVESLLALGFSPDAETRPARLPLTDLALASLRDSSEATGLPQSQLLILALRAYCGEAPQPARKTRKPKTAAEPTKTPKAKGSTKTATKAKTVAKTAKRAPRKTATKGAK